MTSLEMLKEKIFSDRRNLHLIPEPGYCEYKTSQYIKTQLDEMGIGYECVGETGIIAFLKGTSPSKTIAFRTDMDGLSVKEEGTFEEYSIHENYMHACGHDGHMAMMLGLARYLKSPEVELIDNIVMIFQPAEEGPGGAEIFVKAGLLKKYKVDEIYGIHVFPSVQQGRIGLCPGPMMAMTGEFDIEIVSQSAHGAMPHLGIDGVVVASEIVLGLQSIVSRNVNPVKPAVMTIGKIEGGERRNVIAGKCRLEGTLRAFDQSVFNLIKNRMTQYLNGIEAAYDIRINVIFRDMYPPVINDKNLFEEFYENLGELCDIIEPQMISEDFSYYQEEVPGLFYFIGTYNEEKDYIYPLHNSKFNFDNQILINGFETYKSILRYKNCIKI